MDRFGAWQLLVKGKYKWCRYVGHQLKVHIHFEQMGEGPYDPILVYLKPQTRHTKSEASANSLPDEDWDALEHAYIFMNDWSRMHRTFYVGDFYKAWQRERKGSVGAIADFVRKADAEMNDVDLKRGWCKEIPLEDLKLRDAYRKWQHLEPAPSSGPSSSSIPASSSMPTPSSGSASSSMPASSSMLASSNMQATPQNRRPSQNRSSSFPPRQYGLLNQRQTHHQHPTPVPMPPQTSQQHQIHHQHSAPVLRPPQASQQFPSINQINHFTPQFPPPTIPYSYIPLPPQSSYSPLSSFRINEHRVLIEQNKLLTHRITRLTDLFLDKEAEVRELKKENCILKYEKSEEETRQFSTTSLNMPLPL